MEKIIQKFSGIIKKVLVKIFCFQCSTSMFCHVLLPVIIINSITISIRCLNSTWSLGKDII